MFSIFLIFFLWDAIFSTPGRNILGYDRGEILTYVFGMMIVRAFVLSSRTIDVSGEISQGDISNYLIKPVNYFKYWLTRDLSSKALNLIFAVFETIILYFLLKPPFFIQTNPLYLISSLLSVFLAILIFFVLTFITSSVPFWIPEAAWGVHFVVTTVIVEFLSGALFPLDVLPKILQTVLNYTPFPYLIFFPLEVYLGKITGIFLIKGMIISVFWLVFLWWALNVIWRKGLKAYQAYGR